MVMQTMNSAVWAPLSEQSNSASCRPCRDADARLGIALQVPVPRMLCLCEDAAVLGEPFYVMSFLQGRIHLDPALPDLQPEEVTRQSRGPHHLQDSC